MIDSLVVNNKHQVLNKYKQFQYILSYIYFKILFMLSIILHKMMSAGINMSNYKLRILTIP